MCTRLAISRASSAAVTSPRPQLSHDAIRLTNRVSDTADMGVVASAAIFASALCTAGEVANAYPATSMITIWKAKVKILNTPAYHAATMLAGVAFGANLQASSAPRKVSSTANTYG